MLGVANGTVLERGAELRPEDELYVADAVPSGVKIIVMSPIHERACVGRVNEPFIGQRANCIFKLLSLEEVTGWGDFEYERKYVLTLWCVEEISEGDFLSVHYGRAYESVRFRMGYRAGLPAAMDVPMSLVMPGMVDYCTTKGHSPPSLMHKFGELDPAHEYSDEHSEDADYVPPPIKRTKVTRAAYDEHECCVGGKGGGRNGCGGDGKDGNVNSIVSTPKTSRRNPKMSAAQRYLQKNLESAADLGLPMFARSFSSLVGDRLKITNDYNRGVHLKARIVDYLGNQYSMSSIIAHCLGYLGFWVNTDFSLQQVCICTLHYGLARP